MKKILFVVLLLIVNFLDAQVYVKDNTYVYNLGSLVYSKGNVELNGTNSFFYLRNEGQLLQGSSSTSTNKGVGKLSVFQEGSVNNFQYNYWCSPVGNASATTGNEAFGITMLNRPTTVTASTAATILAMSNYNGTANPLAIAPYWIWKYAMSTVYDPGGAGWQQVGSNSTLQAGEGFTMKGSSGTDATSVLSVANNSAGSSQRYDFRGKPNDGNITINVASSKLTLTGNPYPSAIDLTAFLTAATNSTGIAYFWEHNKSINSHFIAQYQGGYGSFSPVSRGGTGIYVAAPFYAYNASGVQTGSQLSTGGTYQRRFSPIGQGFMIEGNTSGTVQMSNSYRVFVKEGAANLSQFERNGITINDYNSGHLPAIQSVSGFDYTTVSTDPVPQIRFKTIINDNGLGQFVLGFDPLATDDADFAMDAKSPNDDAPQEITFGIHNNPYVIDIIDFDINKRVPLILRNSETANYKISVGEILNFQGAQNVYIHDKDNDTYHDIKNGVYEVTLPSGTNTTRFEVTFLSSNLAAPTHSINDLVVLQNNTNHVLTIFNPNSIELKEFSLFDMTGKLILNKSKLGANTNYQFSTLGLSEGIYLVKLVGADSQKLGKKVSIFNQN